MSFLTKAEQVEEDIVLLAASLSAAAASQYSAMNFVRTPQHASVLNGRAWMEEFQISYRPSEKNERSYGHFTDWFSVSQKTVDRKGWAPKRPIYRFYRTAWDIFICSDTGSFYEEVGGTISKKRRNNPSSIPPCPPVLHLEALYTSWIKSATNSTPLHSKIEYSWQYNPYFKDALEPWTVLTFLFPLRTIKEK